MSLSYLNGGSYGYLHKLERPVFSKSIVTDRSTMLQWKTTYLTTKFALMMWKNDIILGGKERGSGAAKCSGKRMNDQKSLKKILKDLMPGGGGTCI